MVVPHEADGADAPSKFSSATTTAAENAPLRAPTAAESNGRGEATEDAPPPDCAPRHAGARVSQRWARWPAGIPLTPRAHIRAPMLMHVHTLAASTEGSGRCTIQSIYHPTTDLMILS